MFSGVELHSMNFSPHRRSKPLLTLKQTGDQSPIGIDRLSALISLGKTNACRATGAEQLALTPSLNPGQNIDNNTPQAYPAVRRGEAQTGGLLLWGLQHAL